MKCLGQGVFFCLCVLVWVMGCNKPSESTPLLEDAALSAEPEVVTTDDEAYVVALVMKTLTNPFFVEMEKGAREAEADLGIKLLVKTGAQETSVEQQITIIEGLIEDDIEAIVIAPADSTALVPVLKQAQEAGIVIVNIDNRLDDEVMAKAGLENVPFISVDNEQGAYLSAAYIANQFEETTQVAILEGIRAAQNAEDRKNGALRAFEESKYAEVVALETANWKIDEAYNVTADIFHTYPDVAALFCANDMMALGAVQYLKENGREDVLVAAYDALDEAKEAIQAGQLEATVDQQAARQGYLGVEYAVKVLAGETLPPETLVDVVLVTKDNVE